MTLRFATRLAAGVCFLLTIATPAHSATKTWSGSVNNLWSVPGNWSSGVPPVDGDDLVFPNAAANHTMVNDIAGLDLQLLSFTGTYAVTGNAVTLLGGIDGNQLDWGVPTTLGVSQTFTIQTISGSVNLNGQNLTISGAGSISGSITGTGNVTMCCNYLISGSLTFNGTLSTTSGGINHPGTITSALNASQTYILGEGPLGATTLTTDSTLSPGAAPLTLESGLTAIQQTGNLSITSSTLRIDINNTTPGTGHDQVAVNGTVTLANATLNLQTSPSLSVGQSFTIIENDNTDPVVGIFNGLPEGGTTTVDFRDYQITYTGGSGNDVVITLVAIDKTWTGAVNNLWSVPGNWSTGVPPVDGDELVFPNAAANHTMVNDIAGLDLQLLSFIGTYAVTGNAVTLLGGIDGNQLDWGVPTTLGASQTFAVQTISGSVNLNGQNLTISGAGSISGSITGTGNVTMCCNYLISGSLTFNGTLSTTSGGINHPGTITSALNASQTYILGEGPLGATTLTTDSTLSPGAAPLSLESGLTAIQQTGNLSITSSTLRIDINNTTPGTGHDQVAVNGTVNLNNATLTLLPVPSPAPGASFVIVANDGADPVAGSFNGLPEGTVFTAGGTPFQITYTGGTGNDIVVNAVIATATTLNATPASPNANQPVTLTAHVTTSGTPTGSVRFNDGALVLGTATLNASGDATLTILLSAGPHSITATYLGDGTFGSSTSPPVLLAVAAADIPLASTTGFLVLILAMAIVALRMLRIS